MTKREKQDKYKWNKLEDIVTLLVCGFIVVSVTYITGSLQGFWGLLILLNLSSMKT